MTGLHLHGTLMATAEYGAQLEVLPKLVVFGQGMAGIAGHGGSAGLYWGRRSCDQVPFPGPVGYWGTSYRLSFIRTHGNAIGEDVRPHEGYIGFEFRAHAVVTFGVGVYRSLRRESGVPQLVTGSAGIGF